MEVTGHRKSMTLEIAHDSIHPLEVNVEVTRATHFVTFADGPTPTRYVTVTLTGRLVEGVSFAQEGEG